MTQVKFCGLKKTEEVVLANELGVDAIGLVLVEKSPRYVDLQQAKELVKANQGQAQMVALLVNPSQQDVKEVIEVVQPDVLQFHGDESPDFCAQFGLPFWKAIPMLADGDWQQRVNQYHQAQFCLLDAFGVGKAGGSGTAFSWFEFPNELSDRLILAGGLTVGNVTHAIDQTGCHYVDVSSGIESIRGVKSPALMREFMQQIKQ